MRVADIMTNASVTESPSDSLRSAADTMWRQQTGSLLVMDGDALVGIITERDVMCRFMDASLDWSRPVSEVMTPDPVTLDCNEQIISAVQLMNENDFRTVPIVDGGTVGGLVRLGDLLRHLAELFPEEILNLPPRPDKQMKKPEGG